MSSEDSSQKKVATMFDGEAASSLVKELRGNFVTGKTRSYEWRISQVKALLKMVDENEEQIIDALRSDLARPPLETVVYEIGKRKTNKQAPPFDFNIQTCQPSNLEVLSLDPVVGAIAAGNAVVLKPSEISPASSSLLANLLGKYMDNSSIRVVEGAVDETTALLQQKWDKIFYTGNGKVGRIVMAAAAKHLTPVVLELGGKSPVVVDSNVNLEVAARRIISGKWGCNNGQACISPDYILTTKDFAPKLVDALKTELENCFGKNPMESKDLSRIVNSNHFARLTKLLDEDKVSGKIVYGGAKDESNLRIAPTLLLDVPRDSLIMSDEIFGPLLPIITVNKLEESFDVINSGTKPLAAYLFTNDNKFKEQFVRNVSAGGLLINDTVLHLVVHTLPFGGVGESGMGAYHGKFSFDAFTHRKAVLYRGFTGDASIRYPPYTDTKLRLMKALVAGGISGITRALFGW